MQACDVEDIPKDIHRFIAVARKYLGNYLAATEKCPINTLGSELGSVALDDGWCEFHHLHPRKYVGVTCAYLVGELKEAHTQVCSAMRLKGNEIELIDTSKRLRPHSLDPFEVVIIVDGGDQSDMHSSARAELQRYLRAGRGFVTIGLTSASLDDYIPYIKYSGPDGSRLFPKSGASVWGGSSDLPILIQSSSGREFSFLPACELRFPGMPEMFLDQFARVVAKCAGHLRGWTVKDLFVGWSAADVGTEGDDSVEDSAVWGTTKLWNTVYAI